MRRVGFRRLFWIGAAVLLGAAALVSITALLRGAFTDTDGKILGTLGAAFLTGSVALSGLALVERRDLPAVGAAVAAVGPLAFAVLAWEVWAGFRSEDLAFTAIVVCVAGILVASARLLHRRLEALFWGSAALTTVTAAVYVWAIQADPHGGTWPKIFGTLGILTVVTFFLVPVAERIRSQEADRVVGRGPGRVEVELADGEELVVRAAR
ncbi:MAG TPA: hypothetical protein VNT58_11985 [Gaiellaceae bacterium]|nr:hypothetical protein [Gaiellaceae bacterium]